MYTYRLYKFDFSYIYAVLETTSADPKPRDPTIRWLNNCF